MNETEKRINKDLILREQLAIERTDMAIDRTLLSFIRTSLYFGVAGLSVNSLLHLRNGWIAEILFWTAGILILVIGVTKTRQQKTKLRNSRKHIGNYRVEWEEDID